MRQAKQRDATLHLCLGLSEYVLYKYNIINFSGSYNITQILLDIHFQQANMVRYRTSVVFDWIDLMGRFVMVSRGSVTRIPLFPVTADQVQMKSN